MLPPRLVRRLVLVPLVIVIAAGLAILTPMVALLSAAFNLVRRPTRTGRAPRSRAPLRVKQQREDARRMNCAARPPVITRKG